MGYEILFKYHDKKPEGGYDIENIQSLKKVIGKATEDTPLEMLAKAVFGQLARRDIWVVDVEVFEYTKKRISYKETKEGIILKHKKFSFDLTCEDIELESVSNQEVPDETVQLANQMVSQVLQGFSKTQQPQQAQPVASSPQGTHPSVQPPKPQALRYEIYDPHPDIAHIAKMRIKNFTVGKRYPIYEEKPIPGHALLGMNYITEDDQGNRRTLNDKHFVPVVGVLERDFENDDRTHQERGRGDQQSYDNLPAIFTLGK